MPHRQLTNALPIRTRKFGGGTHVELRRCFTFPSADVLKIFCLRASIGVWCHRKNPNGTENVGRSFFPLVRCGHHHDEHALVGCRQSGLPFTSTSTHATVQVMGWWLGFCGGISIAAATPCFLEQWRCNGDNEYSTVPSHGSWQYHCYPVFEIGDDSSNDNLFLIISVIQWLHTLPSWCRKPCVFLCVNEDVVRSENHEYDSLRRRNLIMRKIYFHKEGIAVRCFVETTFSIFPLDTRMTTNKIQWTSWSLDYNTFWCRVKPK